jgi:hypothetical protein
MSVKVWGPAVFAVLVVSPQVFAANPPRSDTPGTSAASTAAATPDHARAIRFSVPILGTGSRIGGEYGGPIAPWKVLNPNNPGKREIRFQLSGPVNKSTGKGSVREISIGTDVEKGGREGSMKYSSVVPSELVTTSRTASMTVSQPRGRPPSTSATYAEKFTDANGKSQENAATVSRAPGDDGIHFTMGHVTTEADGKRTAQGFDGHRDRMGNVSGQVRHAGPKRERTVDFGDAAKRGRSLGTRLKSLIFGKELGKDSFANTLPKAE